MAEASANKPDSALPVSQKLLFAALAAWAVRPIVAARSPLPTEAAPASHLDNNNNNNNNISTHFRPSLSPPHPHRLHLHLHLQPRLQLDCVTMGPPPYNGPMSLAASKYASPVWKANFASFPSAVPTAPLAASNAIATMEQIAATATSAPTSTDMAPLNNDAQLAVAQNEALWEEVAKHSAYFDKSVSSAVANTQQLLSLIRDALKKDGSACELQTVDKLWKELELLFEAAKEAKAALPNFLEKQKDNMSLYHSSMMNESFRDTQDELNLQHKKINIQHTLILEHQQAFQDYKAQTESKTKQLSDLQERVSRLTLDKGLLRTELDKYTQLLDKATSGHADNEKAALALRKEFETTQEGKQRLVADNETLRNAIRELQEKLTAAEQRITVYYEEVLPSLAHALAEEEQKQADLESIIKDLQTDDGTFRKKADHMTIEYTKLQEKFGSQGAEFSKLFSEFNDQAKKVATFETDLSGLQKENTELKSRLEKLNEVEQKNSTLLASESALEREVNDLKCRISKFEGQVTGATGKVEALEDQIKKLERENDSLEIDNNELVAKANEHEQALAGMENLKNENAKLRATVQNLQGSVDSSVLKYLEDQLSQSDMEKATMQKELEDWAKLAQTSYQEYKQLLPTYRAAEKYQEESLAKDREIELLKEQLETGGSTPQTNGTKVNGDTAYWKDRYETLLATMAG